MKEYFSKVKEGDEIYGLVFGPGKVVSVWENSYYGFEVEFKEGSIVPYTLNGIPGWNTKLDLQTIFYKKDINLSDYDVSANLNNVLTPKKIIKLRIHNLLEVRSKTGIWRNVNEFPTYLVEEYLENRYFHLFRKKVPKID